MNGYNFTERVRKTLAYAREEAVALHHEYVGTEHILLGILREGEGVAMTVIQNLGAEADTLRDHILGAIKRGDPATKPREDLPYTSRAKKVLELAMSEARELEHSYVGTEHTLLGLLREEKGIAAMVLSGSGVTLDGARTETLNVLGEATIRTKTKRFARRASARPGPSLPKLARRVREIIAAGYNVATARNSSTVLPIHVTIALLEHDGGLANAVLDRRGFNRAQAIAALNDLAPPGATPVRPDEAMTPSVELGVVVERVEGMQEKGASLIAGSNHLLVTLLLTSREVAAVFLEQGVSADDVSEEASRMSG